MGVWSAFEGTATASVLLVGCTAAGLAAAEAAALSATVVLALGCALALREALRFRSDLEHYTRERRREEWELREHPAGEIQEMIEIYVQNGVDKADATTAIKALYKYSRFFVDCMMAQELQIPLPTGRSATRNGVAALVAFTAFGGVPVATFALLTLSQASRSLALVAHRATPVTRLMGRLLPLTASLGSDGIDAAQPLAAAAAVAAGMAALTAAQWALLPQRRRPWLHIATVGACCIAVAVAAVAPHAAAVLFVQPSQTSAAVGVGAPPQSASVHGDVGHAAAGAGHGTPPPDL